MEEISTDANAASSDSAVSGAVANQTVQTAAPSPTAREPAAWEGGKCRTPMWCMGSPAGLCGELAFGPQLPKRLLWLQQSRTEIPYCFGPCCPMHGGPAPGEPIVFQDGQTNHGYPMWCAVMPDFQDLQASPAGFDGDPVKALENLRAAVAKAGAGE